MENREQQILSEIKAMMASIRVQLEKLDDKMAELQQVVDPEDVAAEPIDLEIETSLLKEVAPEVVIQEIPLPQEPVVDEPVVEEQKVEVAEPQPVAAPEEDDDDDLPLFSEPEPVAEPTPIFEAAQASGRARKTVAEVMEDKQAWRTDIPGAPVRDLLSAISLNDRVQFINTLFKGDPSIFQQTRAKINLMTSLDQVVEFITSTFDWDMNSQIVYRFMMAVRRKIQ